MGVVISSAQCSYAVVMKTLRLPFLSLLHVISDSNLARGIMKVFPYLCDFFA
jgi:hypothetical protein